MVCAVSACALVPGSAWAQTTQLQVTAKGSIPGSCTLTTSGSFPARDMTAPGPQSATTMAALSCNQPFKINVTSTNGALLGNRAAASGFSNRQDYALTLSFGIDSSTTPQSATCTSAQLIVGQTACALSPGNVTGLTSGNSIATNKTATLTADWTVATTARLMAGNYSDQLRVTLTPQQ
jgi:hypothetical protein